jgi:YggT family protein
MSVAGFIGLFLQVLSLLILVRVLLSWFPVDHRNPIVRVLYDVTEPILSPFRRVLPTIGMMDLSPLAAMLVLQFLSSQVVPMLR